jgi:lipopolysaccharide export system permease protein
MRRRWLRRRGGIQMRPGTLTMGLFGRYLFAQAFGALVLILSSLTALAWIATALKSLDLVTGGGSQALTFLKVTALAIPNLIAIIAPIALLVACLHVLFRANSDSELIVMTAGGAPVWHFAKPLLLLAALVSLFVLTINLFVMPWSVRTLNTMLGQLRADLIGQVLKPGAFAATDDKRVFHIRARDPKTQEILGLIMHDASEKGQELTYLAERASVFKQGAEAYLVLQNGHIFRRTESEPAPRLVTFESYSVDLVRFKERMTTPDLKPRERFLGELLDPPDLGTKFYAANIGKLRSELHDRFASALYPLVFAMVAIAGVGQARTNRQTRIASVLIAFGAAAAGRLGGFAASNLLTLNANAVALVYGLPVGIILVTGLKAYLAMSPRKTPAWRLRLQRVGLMRRIGDGLGHALSGRSKRGQAA